MADSGDMSRQRVIGGSLGVLLLALALAYRFFPGWMHIEHARGVAGDVAQGSSVTMGFRPGEERGAEKPMSAADAGPPLSLASSEVITARRLAAGGAPASAEIGDWLKRGDAALDAGKLVGEDSAAAWYDKVLDVDADNGAARAGAVEVARRVASSADTALDRGDLEDAERALAQLRQVPLASVEVARIERDVEVQKRVAPMLASAAELLKQGRGTRPANGNALAVYREVLNLDPDNIVAEQGLAEIQRDALDRALAAMAQNDLNATDVELARAASILPDSQALQDTRARVEGLRRLQAESTLAQARSALDGGHLDLAQSLADQAMRISPDVPGLAEFGTRMRNARLYANFRPGQEFSDRFLDRAGNAPTLVVVPTGRFQMGSPENGPVHEVAIDGGFALGRTEVTVGEFRAFVAASGYRTDAERLGGASVYDERSGRLRDLAGANWRDGYDGHAANDRSPVLNVSWNDANAYVKWLGQRTGKTYRLPSEAEFEYAMRAGSETRYWWGENAPARRIENLTGSRDRSPSGRRWTHAFRDYGDGYWGPAPAGNFVANPFGLHDMNGNLSEWVEDCWHDNYVRAPHDGSAWINPGCGKRVVRGGSWGSAPDQVRSGFRQPAAADSRSARVGFRVARDL